MSKNSKDLYLEKMSFEDGAMNMRLGGEASMHFMASLINFYECNGGDNFLTLNIESKDKRYSITIEDTTKKISPAERLIEMQSALSDMVFAYQNKDPDFPHSFEKEALEKAKSLIK